MGLRGYAQRDPLVEYKREAYGYFEKFLDSIAREVVRNLFGLRFRTDEERKREATISREKAYKPDATTAEPAVARTPEPTARVQTSADGRPSPIGRPYEVPQERPVIETYKRKAQKVNRNDPCPCGSGKKYKNCCGKA
ncbi:SEC-C domain-containing protein [candidate division WOR-3 bacterium]|nr:SEC-C domain-containing protein [candidate division WOR-3 bacterium]